jgi:two-component system sensor kinase FixL
VGDTGKGVDPLKADLIFEPFVTKKSSGMGLGLSICGTIFKEAHGGELSAFKCSSYGTVFQFTVPSAASADGT